MNMLDPEFRRSLQNHRSSLLPPFVLLLFIAPVACDNRPVNLAPDSGVLHSDGARAGSDHRLPDLAAADAGPALRCVVATRALPCNFEYVAATVEEVLEDGCLSSPEVPHDTLMDCERQEVPCDALPPAGPPSRLVGPTPDNSGCMFIHECASVDGEL